MNKLKEQRIKKGLTQYQLANKIGISKETLNRIENNKYKSALSTKTAYKLYKELDLNFNDFIKLINK